MALAASYPPVSAAEHPVTTWQRYKNYSQFTAMVLEVPNLVVRQNPSQYQAFILTATDILHIGIFTLRVYLILTFCSNIFVYTCE